MQVYPNPMLGSWKSARNVNAQGEVFFNQQEDDPLAYGPYTVQLKRLVKQVRAGKARYDGGYYSGFDHVDPAEVDAYTTYAKVFKQLGLDVGRDLVETAVSAHYRQGGLLVDPATMASTVPGLFVAGGVGGHSNGLIALVTFDGKVAADSVARHVQGRALAELPRHQAEEEAQRIQNLLRSGQPSPARVKKAIRELMWEDMGVEKSEAGMRRALDRLEEIRTRVLPAMGLTSLTRTLNHGWLEALDAVNMVEACTLMVHAALNRTESRGPFIRTDYPEMDNENWLAQNILVPTGDGGVRFAKRPYDLPYFRPGFARKDNLAVEW
jgi:succinate dehydrogenase/fumarate reductase flavoprotein subunit